MLPTFIKFATSSSRRRFLEDDLPQQQQSKSQQQQQQPSVIEVPKRDVVESAPSDIAKPSSLVVAEPPNSPAPETKTVASSFADESASIVSSISDQDLLVVASPSAYSSSVSSFKVLNWDKKTLYSTYIRDALAYLKRPEDEQRNVIMLFESPSTACKESSFYNCQVYKFHDYPPASAPYKTMLGPCRYSLMNGDAYPSYLQDGSPPEGLLRHWAQVVPGFVEPQFVSQLPDSAHVYAYLPCESIANHINDPHVHYHLAGKDALHLMTKKTTKLLHNTKSHRPCIAKVTHSMASKGIFVINSNEDEAEFEAFLAESGNPTFVVTEFVDIHRNVACHFFIHPSGEVTWFGSNENYKEADGRWSMDSYLIMQDQEALKEMQLPYVRDVVQYCLSLGFWGFCGIDVLFDKDGQGYLVDVNPRVTGSCPSLMVSQLLQDKYGFEYGLFRRNGNITYRGCADELLERVEQHNAKNQGMSQIVLFGLYEEHPLKTKINIAVYGHSLEECRTLLNLYAQSDLPIDGTM